MLRKPAWCCICLLLATCAVVPISALAAGSGQPQQRDPTRPTIMEQAAARAAQPTNRHLAPFRPAPLLSPRAAGASGSIAAAAGQGPSREVFGFVNAGTIADPQVGYPSWHFGLVSTVAFFGIHVNSSDGTLVTNDTGWSEWNSSDLTNLLAAAHGSGVRVVVSIILQDFSAGNGTMCAGLSHAQTTAGQVASEVRAKGIDGVNVDYEGLAASCGSSGSTTSQLTSFVGLLRGALPAGSYLSIDTYASSAGFPGGFFDVRSLSASVDSFFVMAYDLDKSNFGGPPVSCATYCLNPVAPLTTYQFNDTTTASQYTSVVAASQVILGVPYYGRTACVAPLNGPRPGPNALASTDPSTPANVGSPTYLDAASTSSTPGVSAYAGGRDANDAAGREPFATWQSDASHFNCWRESYWDDPLSLGQKYDLVNRSNLRGVGIFTLDYGGGAPELWNALAQVFGFEPLGGTATASPAAVSWGPGRLDVFVRWPDGTLRHNPSSGAIWESLGGQILGAPAVASWGPGRLDVFVRGTDSSLWHIAWNSSAWTGWESLGGGLTAGPTVVSWGSNRLDVLVRGTDSSLWHIAWNSSAWTGWEGLGGGLNGAPAAVSWAVGSLDVFVRGTDNTLWHTASGGSGRGVWENLGGRLIAGPSAVSWGANRLDVFGLGTDRSLWHVAWNGSAWTSWQGLGGFLTTGPAAATTGTGRLDVYGVGGDGGAWHTAGDGSAWSGWTEVGGSWAADSPAVVVQLGSTHVDLFVVASDGSVWHTTT